MITNTNVSSYLLYQQGEAKQLIPDRQVNGSILLLHRYSISQMGGHEPLGEPQVLCKDRC